MPMKPKRRKIRKDERSLSLKPVIHREVDDVEDYAPERNPMSIFKVMLERGSDELLVHHEMKS